MQLNKIYEKFGVKIIAQKDINKGFINTTKMVTDVNGNKFVLQEINSNVFKNIDKLMDNIASVSEYVHKMHKKSKGSVDTVSLLKAKNKFYAVEKDENGKSHYFRMYKFISNASTYDQANEKLLFEAGVGFGNFQKLLQKFPAGELYETIPNFHNTPLRYKNFLKVVKIAETNNSERFKKAQKAIKFANDNKNIASIIVDELKSKNIPIRVVHNDTKLNNVVLSDADHKPVAVIDLDTVMPGNLLFDYGDGIRYCASTSAEDEADVSLIDVDFKKFKAFTKGYIQETKEILTQNELKLMSIAPEVVAYELGLRFLTDYLDGDKYFKVNSHRPDHNLERAMAQFTLASKFKTNRFKIERIINKSMR